MSDNINKSKCHPVVSGNREFAAPPMPKRARITTATTAEKFSMTSGGDRAEDEAFTTSRRDSNIEAFGLKAKCLPCLCCVPDEVKITDETMTSCQAQDSVNNTVTDCVDSLSSNTPNLFRSHVRDRLKALCDNHLSRLRLHQCCPGCGTFCLKGRFNKCRECDRSPHYFHLTCANEFGQCPHCLSTNYAPVDVDLTNYGYAETAPTAARMTMQNNNSSRLLNFHNEPAIRRHTHFIPGFGKPICIADLASASDREAIRSAIKEIDRNIEGNLETLEHSVIHGDLRLLLSVLSMNVDPDTRLSNHLTPLQFAASSGSFLPCYLLLALGANVDLEEPESGRTALMMAASNCQYGICKMLVRYGRADILWKDRSNDTALHLAAKAGCAEIVSFLIYGAGLPSVDEQDCGGWTALMWAAENSHVETVAILLQAGAKLGLMDSEGNIPLHWAAMSGSVDVGKMILRNNCAEQVNKQNGLGYTPLMICCRENHKDFIELLLANGADPTIKDRGNKTADDYLRTHAATSNTTNEDECSSTTSSMLLQLAGKLNAVSTANRNRKKRGLVISDLSRGKERSRINVYNDVDDENVDSFTYMTTTHETSPEAAVDRNIIASANSCACVTECGANSGTCLCATGTGKLWFDETGRLTPDFPYGTDLQPQYLFECNQLCSCSATCRNRVVQRGVSVSLKLVRTADKGWGVFADEDIVKGSFICEYAGELITDKQADERIEDAYIFELFDASSPNADQITNWLCIDSCKFGNISRFINHGCEPNLIPIKVFFDHVDHRAAHVAFFASKDIRKNEELAFDYGPKFWGAKGHYFPCKCRSPKCQYGADKIENFLNTFPASSSCSGTNNQNNG